MPDGGAVKLTIDSDKVGYVKLPNGGILTTSSGVINTTYNGVEGRIIYYVPTATTVLEVQLTDTSGYVIYNGSNSIIKLGGNAHLLVITAENVTDTLVCSGAVSLTSLIAPKATTIDASNCALTSKSIGDILYAAYVDDRPSVVYNFSGGTNAAYGAIDDYLTNTYSVDIDTVVTALDVRGTIQLNP